MAPDATTFEVAAVLFDLDGTLYDLGALKRRLVWRIPGELRRHGILGSWRRFRSLQAFRRARELHRGSERVESLRDTLAGRVSEELGYPLELVLGAAGDFLYRSDFQELRGLSPPEDRPVLEELIRRGYRLGVVSEYPVPGKIEALGLGDLPWEVTVCCEEVGLLKPDPAAFLEAARRLDLPADRVLVVGDRRDADVAGARRAGMPVAWLRYRDPLQGPGPEPDLVLEALDGLLPVLPGQSPSSS